MGCRLVRGETIYFVRHGGPTAGDIERDWYWSDMDSRLLPPVYTRSDGHNPAPVAPSVIPVEIRTFESS